MNDLDYVVNKVLKVIRRDIRKNTSDSYNTGTVKRIDGNIAWVQYDEENPQVTPVVISGANCKKGDKVRIKNNNGTAFILGNDSNPPTDDAKAEHAQVTAEISGRTAEEAQTMASEAEQEAGRAKAAADSAEASATSAQASAENASEYASRALGNLSTVQSVSETLTWITQHGTMTLTSDQHLDPTHVYFVVDAQGDYVVGGTHYSIVAEPDEDDLSTYYELSINESLNNYVGTHLAVTSEGLWLLPDSGGNKVLIATGQGSTYSTAGTYIVGKVNNVDTVLASFTSSGATIGQTSGTYMQIGSYSQKVLDEYGNTWEDVIAQVQDLQRTTTQITHGNGTRTKFALTSVVLFTRSVTVDGVTAQEGVDFTRDGNVYTFNIAPAAGAEIIISAARADGDIHYTFGTRNEEVSKGYCSFAEGILTEASGEASHAEGDNTRAQAYASHAEGVSTHTKGNGYSHAEGFNSLAGGKAAHAEGTRTEARGDSSHAEGLETIATGDYSHSQNFGTEARYEYQTAIGTYNDNKSANLFEVGNGHANAPSNAFEVSDTGDITAPGKATLGAINGDSLFDYTHVSMTSSSIAANASGEVTSSASTLSGYYPIAIANVSVVTGVASLRRFYFSTQETGKAVVKIGVQNDGTSAKTITANADILWVKVTA